MAKTRRAIRRAPLPPVTVEKLEQTGYLLEQLLQENLTVFVEGGERLKSAHRAGSSRPLNAAEAAQLAVAMADDDADRVALAEQLQASELRAYDEPDQREVLLAGGAATAPAFLRAAGRFVALVEMPLDEFEAACEAEQLQEALDERARRFRKLEVVAARQRAARAMAHYAAAAGVNPGKAWRLLIETVWQAMLQATRHLAGDSRPSQLLGSAESSDSTAETSSTDSPGPGQPN